MFRLFGNRNGRDSEHRSAALVKLVFFHYDLALNSYPIVILVLVGFLPNGNESVVSNIVLAAGHNVSAHHHGIGCKLVASCHNSLEFYGFAIIVGKGFRKIAEEQSKIAIRNFNDVSFLVKGQGILNVIVLNSSVNEFVSDSARLERPLTI